MATERITYDRQASAWRVARNYRHCSLASAVDVFPIALMLLGLLSMSIAVLAALVSVATYNSL